ncbi:MAG: hypothetical protein R2932_44815 [Caldilineaceae bacterium]
MLHRDADRLGDRNKVKADADYALQGTHESSSTALMIYTPAIYFGAMAGNFIFYAVFSAVQTVRPPIDCRSISHADHRPVGNGSTKRHPPGIDDAKLLADQTAIIAQIQQPPRANGKCLTRLSKV